MAVWSSLATKHIAKFDLARKVVSSLKLVPRGKGLNYVSVRNSHDRTLGIRTSTYDWFKFKDLFIFYLFLGAIPLISIATYCNIFIGPAELALIPEGYEPQPYEYHRHPITRFFAKYITFSQQELYERSLHNLFEKQEKKMIMALEKKVQNLIKEREDYQAWYFEKPLTKYQRKLTRDYEENEQADVVGPRIV